MSYFGVPGSLGPPGPGGVFVVRGVIDCSVDLRVGGSFVYIYPDFLGDICDPGCDVCFWGFDGVVYFRDRKFKFVGSSDKCFILRPVGSVGGVVDVPEVDYGY